MSWQFPQTFCKFLRRHRNKLIFTGVFVGGVVGALKLAEYKITQFVDDERKKSLKERQEKATLSQIHVHSLSLTESMLESLMTSIMKSVDTEALTEQIKNAKGNKLELWNHLKVAVFSRITTGIYAIITVVIVLRIQLTQIAGVMSLQENSLEDGESKKKFLAIAHDHITEKGIWILAEHVQKASRAVTGDMPLQCLVTSASLQTTLKSITANLLSVEGEFKLSKFAFPRFNEVDRLSHFSDTTLEELEVNVATTLDILDSPDCELIFEQCVQSGIEIFGQQLCEIMMSSSGQNLNDFESFSLPLAKALPLLNQKLQFICSDAFAQHVSQSQILNQFSENILESYECS